GDKAVEEKPKEPGAPSIEGKPEGSGGAPRSHDSGLQTRTGRDDTEAPAPRRATWIYAVVILGVLLFAALLAVVACRISREAQGDEREEERPRAGRGGRRQGLPRA